MRWRRKESVMQMRLLRQRWGQRPRGRRVAGDHDGVKQTPPGGAGGRALTGGADDMVTALAAKCDGTAGAGMVWRGGGAGLTGGSIMIRTTRKRAETMSSELNLFCFFLLDISVCGASRVGGWSHL